MPNENVTGNQGSGQQTGQHWANAKFVERVEMGIMQYVILGKAMQGEVTRENLQQTFRGNLEMQNDHFDHCIKELVKDGHLKENGSKYTISDDGREDVQKLQQLFLEVPNVVQGQGGQQRQTQKQTAGGGSSMGGSSTTGSTLGQQGNKGTSSPQGGNVGSQQGNTQPGNISSQSGVQGQRNTADVSKGGATQPMGDKGNKKQG